MDDRDATVGVRRFGRGFVGTSGIGVGAAVVIAGLSLIARALAQLVGAVQGIAIGVALGAPPTPFDPFVIEAGGVALGGAAIAAVGAGLALYSVRLLTVPSR